MADGEGEPPDGRLDAELGALGEADLRTGVWKRITAWRHTGFLTAFVLAAMALTAVVFWHTFSGQPVLETQDAKLWFLSAAILSLVPLALLLRDSRDNFAHGPSLRLPVLSLTLLVTLAGGLAAASVLELGLGYTPPVLACVFAVLTLVFVPLVWNAANLARFQAEERSKTDVALANIDGMSDSRDAEAMGALVATLVVGSIIAFAICAGIWNETVSFDNLIGIGVGFLVVGAFAVVVFMDPLSDLLPVKWLSRVFGWAARAARPLAGFYDAVDTFLVRIVAVMAGMEHRTVAARYLILGTMLVCFCVLGWYLPPGWGLLPCALGILTAVSVSRLWSWVEDDRALAALTDFKPSTPYRTPMREDYRDETLLGFLFVFFLIPVMMNDAHRSGLFGADMFNLPKGEATRFLDWFGYFGVTLIKAVPIVDWAEIYNFGQPPTNGTSDLISMNSVASQHAVFMARSTVDLVLIASLLQAISITGRNRQQKRLYKAGTDRANRYRPGLIDRLDTFVERTELKRAYMAVLNRDMPWPEKSTTAEMANKRHFDLSKLSQPGLVDFRRYNADRLAQLHGELRDPVARAFIAAIAYERPDLDLAPRLVLLDNLAEKGAPESELYTLLDRVEMDLADNATAVSLSIEVLRSILFHTAKRAGLKEFKEGVIALMLRCGPAEEVIDALADVAGRSNPDAYQYTRKAAVEAIVASAIKAGEDRATGSAIQNLQDVQKSKPGPTTSNAVQHALVVLGELRKNH
ncbi:MAG: hypothetical protein R3C08_00460 [Hyphomonas sp.]